MFALGHELKCGNEIAPILRLAHISAILRCLVVKNNFELWKLIYELKAVAVKPFFATLDHLTRLIFTASGEEKKAKCVYM